MIFLQLKIQLQLIKKQKNFFIISFLLQFKRVIKRLKQKFKSREQIKREIKKDVIVDIDREDINIDYETILDTCGTGGDGTKTFNISTATAFVVAGCGVIVAKHGNRAVSSLCGSADVIEQMGIKLEITKEKAEKCLSEIGITFLFAPVWHTAMKYAIGPRRQIGIRTIFNILGPLTNPANANAQVLGVYSENLVQPIAKVLNNLGVKHAFVVHSEDMLDEISISGKTTVAELKDSSVSVYTVTPEQFGFTRSDVSNLYGGDAKQNAGIIFDIISGKLKGPKLDIVLLNSAFALVASGKVAEVKEGLLMAKESIDKGYAIKKVELLKKYTNE